MNSLQVAIQAAWLSKTFTADATVIRFDLVMFSHMHNHFSAPLMLVMAALGEALMDCNFLRPTSRVLDLHCAIRVRRERAQPAKDMCWLRLFPLFDLLRTSSLLNRRLMLNTFATVGYADWIWAYVNRVTGAKVMGFVQDFTAPQLLSEPEVLGPKIFE